MSVGVSMEQKRASSVKGSCVRSVLAVGCWRAVESAVGSLKTSGIDGHLSLTVSLHGGDFATSQYVGGVGGCT